MRAELIIPGSPCMTPKCFRPNQLPGTDGLIGGPFFGGAESDAPPESPLKAMWGCACCCARPDASHQWSLVGDLQLPIHMQHNLGSFNFAQKLED